MVCLGDTFRDTGHDTGGVLRLCPGDGVRLRALTEACDWLWRPGDHGARPPAWIGGEVIAEAALGPLAFRHQAQAGGIAGEVSGHFHPKDSVSLGGKRMSCRCFVTDGRHLILPAFGTPTGGTKPAAAG